MHKRALVFASILGLLPLSAAAQGIRVGGQASGSAGQPAATRASSTAQGARAVGTPPQAAEQRYLAMVYEGLRRIVLRDTATALATLREAATSEPTRPEAFCHLGDSQRIAGELEEAVAAYQSCTRFADAAGNTRYALIGRVGQAITLEGMLPRRDEAHAIYESLRSSESGVPAKALAEERIRVLQALQALDEKYAPVRERIKAREENKAAEGAEAARKNKR